MTPYAAGSRDVRLHVSLEQCDVHAVGQPLQICRFQMKKAETASFRPFFTSCCPDSDACTPLDIRLTSLFPRRHDFADGLFVIPAAAAERLVHTGRRLVDRGLGLLMALTARQRAASDRKLVDLGRSALWTRRHQHSPWPMRMASIMRPTPSVVVTDSDIGGRRRPRNVIKEKSLAV
jgi:hypothetical protein